KSRCAPLKSPSASRVQSLHPAPALSLIWIKGGISYFERSASRGECAERGSCCRRPPALRHRIRRGRIGRQRDPFLVVEIRKLHPARTPVCLGLLDSVFR